MLLHAQHASQQYQKILISSPDTDVFIICLSFQPSFGADLYFLTGVKNTRRIINITAVVENINQNLNFSDATLESLLSALIGFHSFTGCDTTSSFAGRGKVKPLMLMLKSKEYIETFKSLGAQIEIADSTVTWLNRFVCHMYNWKGGEESINEIRYRMYCQSGGKIACEKLPPCKNVLQLHILRSNYQAFIWRESLLAQQTESDPLQNGW